MGARCFSPWYVILICIKIAEHDKSLLVFQPLQDVAFPAADPMSSGVSLSSTSHALPSGQVLKRPRVHSVAEAGPSSSKRSRPLDPPTVSLTTLKEAGFLQIVAQVVWAKGYYCGQCLIREPYLKKPEKLVLAEKAHKAAIARTTVPIVYNNVPSDDELRNLVGISYKISAELISAFILDFQRASHFPIKFC